jgi:hypothetical protein
MELSLHPSQQNLRNVRTARLLYSIVTANFRNFGADPNEADIAIVSEHIDEYTVPEELESQEDFISYFDYCHDYLGLPENSTFDVAKENFIALLALIEM